MVLTVRPIHFAILKVKDREMRFHRSFNIRNEGERERRKEREKEIKKNNKFWKIYEDWKVPVTGFFIWSKSQNSFVLKITDGSFNYIQTKDIPIAFNCGLKVQSLTSPWLKIETGPKISLCTENTPPLCGDYAVVFSCTPKFMPGPQTAA